jgi:hypothetical protein
MSSAVNAIAEAAQKDPINTKVNSANNIFLILICPPFFYEK